MRMCKVDLTIYGSDADTMIAIIPDLLRIIKASGLECEVGKFQKRVEEGS
jgi:hypothetical protein